MNWDEINNVSGGPIQGVIIREAIKFIAGVAAGVVGNAFYDLFTSDGGGGDTLNVTFEAGSCGPGAVCGVIINIGK